MGLFQTEIIFKNLRGMPRNIQYAFGIKNDSVIATGRDFTVDTDDQGLPK